MNTLHALLLPPSDRSPVWPAGAVEARGRHHANDPIIFVATARGRTKGLGEPSHRHPCSPIDSTANRQSTRGVDTDALPKARVVATFFANRQPPIVTP